MALKLKVTQVKSGINRPETHKRTLEGPRPDAAAQDVVLDDTPRSAG